ncbi:proteophosphoglycan ppg4 [Rhodotorula toruloides]|uniref:Proteophosphoglycan ppg4 n=1 Tax=Rhodotorula toruloides TaxID=5286 RepID=A0A511KN91_RHOTO|nr:proteophosphoglycan ppg4 [Rhodotorula toruloides]
MSAKHAVRAPFEGDSPGGAGTRGAGKAAGEELRGAGEPNWWASEDLKKRQRGGIGGAAASGGGLARGGRGHAPPCNPSDTNPSPSFASPPYPIQSAQRPWPDRLFGPAFVNQGFVPSSLFLSPNASTFTPLGSATVTPLGPLPPHPTAHTSDEPPSSGFYVNHEEYRGQEEDLHVQPDGLYTAFPAPQLAHSIVLPWTASQAGSSAGGDVRHDPEGMLTTKEKERIFGEARQKKGSRAIEIKRPPPKVVSAPRAVEKDMQPVGDIKKRNSPASSNNSTTFNFSPRVADFRPRSSSPEPAWTSHPPLPLKFTAKPTEDPLTAPPSTADSTRAPPTFGLLNQLNSPTSSTISVADSSATSLVPYGESDAESDNEAESSAYATPPTISKTPTSVRSKSPEAQRKLQRSSAPSPPPSAPSEVGEEQPQPSDEATMREDDVKEAGGDENAEATSVSPGMKSVGDDGEAANTTEVFIVFPAEIKIVEDGASTTTTNSTVSSPNEEPPIKRFKMEQVEESTCESGEVVGKKETQTFHASSSSSVNICTDALVHASRANALFSPAPLSRSGNWESVPSFNLISSPSARAPLNLSVSPFNPSTDPNFISSHAWNNGSSSIPTQFGPVPPPHAQQQIRLRTVESLLRDTMEANGVLRRKVEKFKVAYKEQAIKLAAKDVEAESARKELVGKLERTATKLEQARRSSSSSVSIARFTSEETKRALLDQRKELVGEKEAAVKKLELLLDIETKRSQSLQAVRMRDDKLRATDDALNSLDGRIKKSEQHAGDAVRVARATEAQHREDFERRLRAAEADRRKELESRMVDEKKALEGNMKSLEEKLEASEDELLQASASVELMKVKSEDATGKLKALSVQLNDMVASRNAALDDVKTLKDELSQAHASIARWKGALEEKGVEVKTVSAELKGMVAARDAALTRWREVKNELDMRCRELDEAKDASKKAREAEMQAALSLASIKTVLKEKENELTNVEYQRDEAIREIIRLDDSMAEPGKELIAANKTCDEFRITMQELEKRADSLDTELSTVKTESETFRSKLLKEITRLPTQVKEAQEQQARVSKLERDLADAQQKVDGAEIAKKQVELERDETRKKLESEQTARTALEDLFRQKNEYKETEFKLLQERAKVEQGELRQRIQRLEEELIEAEHLRTEAGQHVDAVLAETAALREDKAKLEKRIAQFTQNKAESVCVASRSDAGADVERSREAPSETASTTSSAVHTMFARRPVASKTLELLSKTRKA